jgi:hypothetical protein
MRAGNPAPLSTGAKLDRAANLYKQFSGHDPAYVDKIRFNNKGVGLVIGECDGVLYTTIRDGKRESYIHKFKKQSRPLLAVSFDGKQLYILSGAYTFTERGIVDN